MEAVTKMASTKAKHLQTARLTRLFFSGGLILVLIAAYFYSAGMALNLPTFHLDGAFQTASGLMRLNSGQHPGADFFPYLGIGPIFLLYPVFVLGGAKLASSVTASYLMTMCSGAAGVGITAFLLAKERSVVKAFFFFVAFMSVVLLFGNQLPVWLIERVEPGNSLRPIRSLLPYLISFLTLVAIQYVRNARIKYFVLGIICGLGLLWSNDFAIPSTLGLIVFIAGFAFYKQEMQGRYVISLVIGFILSSAGSLVIITNGSVIPLLAFNFHDVATDQWWYYVPYSSSSKIFDFSDIKKLWGTIPHFGLVVIAALVYKAFTARSLKLALAAYIGFSLLGGGLVATIGGHIDAYFLPFAFWAKTVFFFAVAYGLLNLVGGLKYWSRLPFILSILSASIGGIACFTQYKEYSLSKAQVKIDSSRFFVAELGGYLPIEWREYINEIRSTDSVALEEYWGIWSSMKGAGQAVPVDSVIHALGATRETVRQFLHKNPPIIVTSKFSVSPDWQPWSLGHNWWFYSHVLENYQPVLTSPTTVVWKPAPKKAWPTVLCSLLPSKVDGVRIIAPNDGYYEVALSYQIRSDGFGRKLLMVENGFIESINIASYFSLNPTANSAAFPVYALGKGDNVFKLHIMESKNASSEILLKSCVARKINDKGLSDVLPSQRFKPFDLTDANWFRGVSRSFAGFFVLNTKWALNNMIPGREIEFVGGIRRTIIRAEKTGDYINVYLDGLPLDGKVVGYPSKFNFTNPAL